MREQRGKRNTGKRRRKGVWKNLVASVFCLHLSISFNYYYFIFFIFFYFIFLCFFFTLAKRCVTLLNSYFLIYACIVHLACEIQLMKY